MVIVLMKEYMVFITYRNGFDIMEIKEKNRTVLVDGLRQIGYKVSLCLSKETYEGYQLAEPEVFFETYPMFREVYKCEVVMRSMFGIGENLSE